MPSPARWTNAGALACLGLALGSATCAAVPHVSSGRADEIALSTLGLEIFLGFLAVACVLPTSASPLRRLGLGAGRLSHAQLLLLALGTLGLSHALDGALSWTQLRESSALAELDEALIGLRGRSLLLAVAALVLAPAVGEELMCRGLVQRGLEMRVGAPAAIALSAAFFGSLHLEPIHATVAMLLGLYLGSVAWLAGSIRASIFCHLVNNGVALVTLSVLHHRLPDGWTIAGGAALAALALGLVWQRAGSPPRLVKPSLSAPAPLAAPAEGPAAPRDGSAPAGTDSIPLQQRGGSDDA